MDLKRLLADKLSDKELELLPRSFDIIGDIAQIGLPEELKSRKKLVADAIMQQHKNVKTVVNKTSATAGIERIRHVEVIAGEKRTETVHNENGCRFMLDINKVFFTGRLSNERMRISNQVTDGETVVDLFAGVGPYSILIAKMHKNCKVCAVDINRDAIDYLMRNIALNKVRNVNVIHGDARDAVKKIGCIADRVIMNLPKTSDDFLDIVPAVAKKGATVHFYYFLQEGELFEKAIEIIREKMGHVKILDKRICGDIAPKTYRVCVDFKLSR